ncbi:MAG TPA: flagellar hook-length control protein FliK [Povalibacter sp.]|uniref:flagellar hook-length control protein FliK n=1 Tax=Povalibacter sp. TaxID=1962978 RepID=UPI002BE83C57|nr:flagellar hook-length control protein FliK [Povalibacter sp.]HMN43148.1 flagellar hook-length control protein FliK [Povalibacter sp.]
MTNPLLNITPPAGGRALFAAGPAAAPAIAVDTAMDVAPVAGFGALLRGAELAPELPAVATDAAPFASGAPATGAPVSSWAGDEPVGQPVEEASADLAIVLPPMPLAAPLVRFDGAAAMTIDAMTMKEHARPVAGAGLPAVSMSAPGSAAPGAAIPLAALQPMTTTGRGDTAQDSVLLQLASHSYAGAAATLAVFAGDAAGATEAAAPVVRQPLAALLGERLQVQIGQRSEHAVVRLDPPSMGTIEIIIRQEAGSLHVQMRASNSDVARQLHAIGETLRQDLVQRQQGDVSVQVSDASRDADGRQRQRAHTPWRDEAPGRALNESGGAERGSAFALNADVSAG